MALITKMATSRYVYRGFIFKYAADISRFSEYDSVSIIY